MPSKIVATTMELKLQEHLGEEGMERRGHLASRYEYCRFRKKMFRHSTFLLYFVCTSIAPMAMSHRMTSTPAFVTRSGHRRLSRTRVFFDNHNIHNQEQRTNSTGMTTEGIARSDSLALSASTVCTASDNFGERNNRETSNGGRQLYKVYCDMDGCLVNFEKGVRMLLKTGSSDIEKRHMWEGISRAPLWFEELEWQMDGRRLWNAIKHLNPDILTGVPELKSSRVEKFNWCKRELGIKDADAHHVDMAAYGLDGLDDHQSVNGNTPRDDKTNIITCWSNHKYKECNRQGSILIDDRIDLKQSWEAAGGIFIHHVNTETTIRKLRDVGVISGDQLEKDENDWYWEGSWRLWRDEFQANTETTIRQFRDVGGVSEAEPQKDENDSYWEGSWRMWRGG
mmetsp:Transcript_4870/g.10079  ORF Transcript_4870/g.10079 Transcript_4870/m.10079 type:complete len:396 (-) Transcript_4870:16-1203(-)